ncbi:MAG: zinc metallopeptidase [Acidobacteriota bacterium]|nr:zinc metallopeptidase [Acidobacteriota bacterium]
MFFGFFDPIYFVFIGPGILLSLWASAKTKSAFNKYSKVRAASGLTGAQAAERLLHSAGIDDVKIVSTKGMLSDHYNPMTKTLALSEPVYGQPSISAIGVACHEAGHAIQHSKRYAPLQLRSAIVPTVGIGTKLGYVAMIAGFFMRSPELMLIGVGGIALLLLFQIVTLPVEFDASKRAKKLAWEQGIVLQGERAGVSKVLDAAALTYVAAAVSTALTLLYYVMRLGLLRR